MILSNTSVTESQQNHFFTSTSVSDMCLSANNALSDRQWCEEFIDSHYCRYVWFAHNWDIWSVINCQQYFHDEIQGENVQCTISTQYQVLDITNVFDLHTINIANNTNMKTDLQSNMMQKLLHRLCNVIILYSEQLNRAQLGVIKDCDLSTTTKNLNHKLKVRLCASKKITTHSF